MSIDLDAERTDGLQLAVDEVPEIAAALDLEDELQEGAVAIAKRVDLVHPINRSPRVVAAASVYLACLFAPSNITQESIADAADVSTVAIRFAYNEILDHEQEIQDPPLAAILDDDIDGRAV